MVLWQMVKCYGHVDNQLLFGKGRQERCPLAALRASLRAYRWPRAVVMDGMVAQPAWPTRGIIGGSVIATSELKAYCIGVVRRHTRG